MSESPTPAAGRTAHSLSEVPTPALLLDEALLRRNAGAFLDRARALGVQLRPHVKTAKSVEVARVACGGAPGPVTVSTLLEAEHLVAAGFTDVLWAQGVTPDKFGRLFTLLESGADVRVVTDEPAVAASLADAAARAGCRVGALVEIDSGEHRAGLLPDDPRLVETGRLLHAGPGSRLDGVMTHAGHSYAEHTPDGIRRVAGDERAAVVAAAARLAAAGLPCPIRSIGSTPTFRYGDDFSGITEVRAGVYVFYDLSQAARGVCSADEIALTVLATVIGHNRPARRILLDAGALALSKDVGATTDRDRAYGEVCGIDGAPLPLRVGVVYQEHGVIEIDDPAWFDRLPVGARVRVRPNHACLTAAGGYDRYHLLRGGRLAGAWPRFNGW